MITDQIKKMSHVELSQSMNFQEGRLLQIKENLFGETHAEAKEDLVLCRRILLEVYLELEWRGLL